MKRVALSVMLCVACNIAFAGDANLPSLQGNDSEPWWVSLVTAAVTAIIGLFSRWFEKKFLQKRVTDALVKQIQSRDPRVDKKDVAALVASAFSKHSGNGKQT